MVTDQVCDDLTVAAGPEGVGRELLPELFMVIDLPVHGDSDGLVFVVERLVAGGGVDDGEALVGEVAVVDLVHAAPVGAAVLEPARELQDMCPLPLGVIGAAQHRQYAAHFDRIDGSKAMPNKERALCRSVFALVLNVVELLMEKSGIGGSYL